MHRGGREKGEHERRNLGRLEQVCRIVDAVGQVDPCGGGGGGGGSGRRERILRWREGRSHASAASARTFLLLTGLTNLAIVDGERDSGERREVVGTLSAASRQA